MIPLYYARDERLGYSPGWVRKCKRSMSTILPHFNMNRVVHDYSVLFYGPAARRGRHLAADGYAVASSLAAWKQQVRTAWPGVALRLASTVGNADRIQRERHAGSRRDTEWPVARRYPARVRRIPGNLFGSHRSGPDISPIGAVPESGLRLVGDTPGLRPVLRGSGPAGADGCAPLPRRIAAALVRGPALPGAGGPVAPAVIPSL